MPALSASSTRTTRHAAPVLVSMLATALALAGLVNLRPAAAATSVFTSTVRVPIGQTTEVGDGSGMITINDAPPGDNVQAAATPYPSVAPINGLAGTVSKVVLRINGYTHPSPGDVDVMLIAPNGQSVVVMSDNGGGLPVSNLDLVFDDSSSKYFDNASRITSGTYHPDNFGGTDDPFPAPAPSTPNNGLQAMAYLNGGNPNGNWSLYVVDDVHVHSGSIFNWSITVTSTGPDPYPSTIEVSGAPGTVNDVDVHLNDLSHGYPEDVDLFVVGPTGQQATLLSDIPQSSGIEDVDLVLDDDAADPIGKPIVSGTFRPTNLGTGPDEFPAPAPSATGSASLSVFDGTDPNGTWKLYAADDQIGRMGDILGWSLDITATDPVTPATPSTPSPPPSAAGVDAAGPLVTSTRPGARAVGVRRGVNVSATLNEKVLPSSVRGSAVYLVRKGSARHVRASVTWDAVSQRIVVDPRRRLQAAATYRVVVTTAVRDLSGNRLDQSPDKAGLQSKTFRFTIR